MKTFALSSAFGAVLAAASTAFEHSTMATNQENIEMRAHMGVDLSAEKEAAHIANMSVDEALKAVPEGTLDEDNMALIQSGE
jgi:hypothetical protein